MLFNRKVKLCKIGFSTGKSENSGFSENFGAGDLKAGRCRQLSSAHEVCEYSRSMSFLTLSQGNLQMKINACFSHSNWAIFTQFCM